MGDAAAIAKLQSDLKTLYFLSVVYWKLLDRRPNDTVVDDSILVTRFEKIMAEIEEKEEDLLDLELAGLDTPDDSGMYTCQSRYYAPTQYARPRLFSFQIERSGHDKISAPTDLYFVVHNL